MDNIVWSMSKSDTAMSCMYKYNKVYNEKIKESSDALTLGTLAHELLANNLVSRNTCPEVLKAEIDAMDNVNPEIYTFIPSIVNFVDSWYKLAEPKGIEGTIEQQYAVNREGKKVDFHSPDAYIRGVFDLWAYIEAEETLVVLDHKSNKALGGKAYVMNHNQLKLYAWMLIKIFNLKCKKVRVAINFIRHDKVVFYEHSAETIEQFGKKYMKLLNILEDQITEAYETSNWKPSPGYSCSWCSFRGECSGI